MTYQKCECGHVADIHDLLKGVCGVALCECTDFKLPVAPAPTASAREDEPSIQDALRIAAQVNEAYGRNRAEATSIIRKLFRDHASSQSEKLAGVGQQAAEEIVRGAYALHGRPVIAPELVVMEQEIKGVAAIIDRVIVGRVKP